MIYLLHLLGALGLFAIALATAVALHETGHYLAARAVGVRVLRVRIGFGRPVLSIRDTRGTMWLVAPAIVGGLTVMLDHSKGPLPAADQPHAFDRQPLWRRVVIILGGSAANLAMPTLVLAWLLAEGIVDAVPVVREPIPATMAAAAGVSSGDRIATVNGIAVASWWRFEEEVDRALSSGSSLVITLRDSSGGEKSLRISSETLRRQGPRRFATKNLGLERIRGDTSPIIGRVVGGSAAARGGLKPGDHVVEIAGAPVASWADIARKVERHPGVGLRIRFQRDGRTRDTTVTPAARDFGAVNMGVLGIFPLHSLSAPLSSFEERAMPGPEAIRGAVLYALGVGQMAIENLIAPFTGGDPLFGRTPVIAAQAISDAMQGGPLRAVALLCALSVCLGWFNLLPIPPLDGAAFLRAMAGSVGERLRRWWRKAVFAG